MIIAVLGIRCKSTARQKKRIAALFQNHRGGYGIRPYQPMHMRTFSARIYASQSRTPQRHSSSLFLLALTLTAKKQIEQMGGYGIRPYQPMHMRTFSARREGVAWFYSRPLISRLFSSATGFSVI
jgi:hypothetical protein